MRLHSIFVALCVTLLLVATAACTIEKQGSSTEFESNASVADVAATRSAKQTAIAESTAVATATHGAATAAANITPTPDPNGPELAVTTSKAVDEAGITRRVVGEVTNVGQADAAGVKVTVTLTDAAGAVLATETTTDVRVMPFIPVGKLSPFIVEFNPLPTTSVANVAIDVAYKPAGADDARKWFTPTVDGLTWENGIVEASLGNPYDHAIRFPRVLIAGYDDAGVLIDIREIYSTARYQLPARYTLDPLQFPVSTDVPIPASLEVYTWAAMGF
jgi:hypothetical protein